VSVPVAVKALVRIEATESVDADAVLLPWIQSTAKMAARAVAVSLATTAISPVTEGGSVCSLIDRDEDHSRHVAGPDPRGTRSGSGHRGGVCEN